MRAGSEEGEGRERERMKGERGKSVCEREKIMAQKLSK